MAKRILLIDDEELITKSLSRLLSKEGYEVIISKSGLEGLEQVKQGIFDLIVSDVRMPDMDGIETITKIRQYLKKSGKKTIPEILITGYADAGKFEKATDLKITDYIYKPFETADFIAAVKRVIG